MSAPIAKVVHNTGCLPIELVVTYPFHPFAGQLVPIVGHIEHAGTRHLIIRTADKSGFLLPSWMTTPEAGAIQIVPDPQLPLNRIIELRALVDRLMVSSSGEPVPTGGQRYEKNVTTAESVRPNTSSQRAVVAPSLEGNRAAQKTANGSDSQNRDRKRHPSKKASGQ
jgi:hypothetical protein